MASTRDVLLRAADLVESGWTRGYYARDDEGKRTSAYGTFAVSFCAIGAIYRAASECDVQPCGALNAMGQQVGTPIGRWNDRWWRRQTQVVQALRHAAALATDEAS